jgi:hypothetical protein
VTLNSEAYEKKIERTIESDEGFWSEDYVWATSEEAKRDAMSLHVIGSIVHKHGGTVTVDTETRAVNIDVPNEAKLALAEELSRKTGMTLQ